MNLSMLFAALMATQASKVPEAEPLGLRVAFGFGPYAPSVDREFSGRATPYADVFGDSTGWLFRPELSWVKTLSFGELTVSGSVGWFKDSAYALVEGTDERSGGETSIKLIPMTALVGLRLYGLEQWLRVPLHPYFELGLSYTLWTIRKGDGEVAEVDGVRASGGSLGVVGTAGLALALERLDPRSARVMRESFGVHGTDLFFEWSYGRTLPLFEGALRVGDSNWQVGLQFTF